MNGQEKNRHAAICNPKYTLARSDKFGRYLIAAQNISSGEVIFRENAVIVGPTTFGKDYFCYGCLRLLPQRKKEYVCSKCDVVPLCGIACEQQQNYHTSEECEIFQDNKNISKTNVLKLSNILLPWRLWLLKKTNSPSWEKIACMESHVNERRNTSVWKDREDNVINVNIIRYYLEQNGPLLPKSCFSLKGHSYISLPKFFLPKVLKQFDLVSDDERLNEDLQQICGILDVNTFEVRSPGGLDGLLLRGLYLESSLMAHDCRGNTHLTVNDDFQLTVYASLPIQQGETIFLNYTSSLLGTAERRAHLREGKYFLCECLMCKDPYELKSHLSAILCPRCKTKSDYVVMQNPMDINPYCGKTNWHCGTCGRMFSGRLVRTTLEITRQLIDEVDDSDMSVMERLIKKLSTSLHPNHFLLLTLKQKLLAAYRREVSSLNPQRKIIQKMMDLCQEMFNILEIVEPGISRLKGIMLYEMHLPKVLLANRSYASREINSKELAARLKEAGDLLKRSLTMLLLEPVETPEGLLAKRALHEFKMLNQNIMDIKALSFVSL